MEVENCIGILLLQRGFFFLQSLQKNRYLQTLNKLHRDNIMIACVASVSVWFRSNERQRNGIFCFGRARNGTRTKNERGGRGRKETLADKPRDFENPARQLTGRLIGSASRTLGRGRDRHMNFLRLLFILVGKICPLIQEHFL